MPMPTLPVIQWSPPFGFFKFLDYGGEALAEFLLLITLVITTPYFLWLICKFGKKRCDKNVTNCHILIWTTVKLVALNVQLAVHRNVDAACAAVRGISLFGCLKN